MNLREQFKKETGESATFPYKNGLAFTADYTEWLEYNTYKNDAAAKRVEAKIEERIYTEFMAFRKLQNLPVVKKEVVDKYIELKGQEWGEWLKNQN